MQGLTSPVCWPAAAPHVKQCIHVLCTRHRCALLIAAAAKKRGAKPSKQSSPSPPDWVDLDSIGPQEDLSSFDWGGYAKIGKALGPEPSQDLVRCHDKNRLKPALRDELARRLRREAPEMGVFTGHIQVLRVFRYALDDLRLFKAIHEAGMEGRVVVVDDPSRAHVVLATRKTRTGREAPMDNARGLAANQAIPYIQLDTISGIRLMEALAPLMGIPIPQHLLLRKAPPVPVLKDTPVSIEALQVLTALQHPGPHPPAPAQSSSPQSSSHPAAPQQQQAADRTHPVTIGSLLAGIHISRSAATTSPPATSTPPTALPPSARSSPQALSNDVELQLVDGIDVEDRRRALLPPNPTERLGPRDRIAKPIQHGRRRRMRQQLKQVAAENAPW